MPDAPMPKSSQASPADDEQAESKSPADLLAEAGDTLQQFVQTVTSDPSVPDTAKQAFSDALAAFTKGAAGLQDPSASQGGPQGAPPAPAMATPEQGASGAQPMSMNRMS